MIAAMAQGLRKNLLEKPREKMQMILEIWAEAGRNPAIAALCDTIDAHVEERLGRRGRERRGRSGGDLDVDFAARVMMTVAVGLFKRRALKPISTASASSPWRSRFCGLVWWRHLPALG